MLGMILAVWNICIMRITAMFKVKKKKKKYALSKHQKMHLIFLRSFMQDSLCIQKLLIHWSKQLKDQPVLLLSSFVHNSSIIEHKNMKLKENTC